MEVETNIGQSVTVFRILDGITGNLAIDKPRSPIIHNRQVKHLDPLLRSGAWDGEVVIAIVYENLQPFGAEVLVNIEDTAYIHCVLQ